MTPLESRLSELKGEVEELRLTSEESEIGFNKVKEFLNIMGNIDTKTENGKQVFKKAARKYLDTELEYLRDKSAIIRKVSPKTANFLEEKINDYDKSTSNVLNRILEKDFPNDSSGWALLGEVFEIAKVIYYMGHLHSTITVSCDSFLDTIDYLEGNKDH